MTAQILDFFSEWRSAADLRHHLQRFSIGSVKKAVDQLVAGHLLDRRPVDRRSRSMDTWSSWNPEAGFFHFSTKDVAFTDEREGDIAKAARRQPPPPQFKRYPRATRVALPAPRKDGEYPNVLLGRRTWRRFDQRPILLDELGTLLGLTWGVHGWMSVDGLGRVPLKTSPSGGARHPIEVYVLARRVKGLGRGLYHYDPVTHHLHRLRNRATAEQLVSYLPQQAWYGDAGALMLMTAVFARTRWRYSYSRAYRVVTIEAGHLCQTFCLTATWLGLAPFCTAALADSRIEKDLGLDGITESVLYATGVGTRPPGVKWAPRPASHARGSAEDV